MSEDQAFYAACDAVSADAGNQCSCGQALCPDEVTYLRYEALRRLNPRQFEALWNRNMAGENFDAMVDEMVRKNATETEGEKT